MKNILISNTVLMLLVFLSTCCIADYISINYLIAFEVKLIHRINMPTVGNAFVNQLHIH